MNVRQPFRSGQCGVVIIIRISGAGQVICLELDAHVNNYSV